ncbi:MAG: DUF86 domain-containing protein [Bacteroidaceae bacterium]|nr:DUF86 domain-containing protein [Bacteroidaceae bacterium]
MRDILEQILGAIDNLQTWNASLSDVDELLSSPEGMKTLAADCMLIEAIGEGFKKIDHKTDGKLLSCRPEIPWRQVIGMRDHIAHGYFDINIDYVWDVLQNDLVPLRAATEYFLEHLEELL